MGCCGDVNSEVNSCGANPAEMQEQSYINPNITLPGSLKRFESMVENALAYVEQEKPKGKHVVGIMCEYTPREIIMAAGGMPVCLCGGSQKMIPAAEEFLPANLCPLIKSTYGFSVNNANPFLKDMELLVAETTCDGKKKMYELLERRHAMYVLELPQKAGDPDAMDHWAKELRKLVKHLELLFGTTVTDEKLWESIRVMNRERSLRRRLAQLLARPNSPITGRQLLDMKSLISGIPEDLDAYEKGIEELENTMVEKKRRKPVRILLTGVPMPHGAERVMNIIEQNGGLVVAQENCTGLKPIWTDVDETASDPIMALARKYFEMPCSVLTKNKGREDLITELAKEFKAEAVIDLSWMACLTYDVESALIKELCETKLDLPYLRISTDYSPNDSARIALRMQALFETASCSVSI